MSLSLVFKTSDPITPEEIVILSLAEEAAMDKAMQGLPGYSDLHEMLQLTLDIKAPMCGPEQNWSGLDWDEALF